MDDHKQRLEDILAEWDQAEAKGYDPITCSVTDTINLSSLGANANVSLTSPYTYTSSINLGAFPNTIYTTNGTNTLPWMTQASLSSPKIQLNGESADIEVNGWSLVEAVKRIEERLGLFQPNPELETEWSNLRELGEQYRKLEQQIKDKQATWDRLKAMPAPDID
jgi:hypothetical protein